MGFLWVNCSKCNYLKTNHVFKNELGRPRAICYLTPPPLAFFSLLNVHVQSVSLVVNFGLSFLFSLIIFNYFSQIRFNFSLFKKIGGKKVTLGPRHGTIDPRRGTLDPLPSTKR